MNTSYIISCALTGTLSFLLGIFVYLRNRFSNVNKVWFLLGLSISYWHWGLLTKELVTDKTTGLLVVRLCYVGAVFIPAFFFHFVNSFLKLEKTRLIAAFYALSFTFLIFDFTPLFIKDVRPILSFRNYGIPGTIYPFYTVSFISVVGYGHYLLIKYFKKSEGQTRNQIRYILFAAIVGFLGGVSTFLPNFNIEVFPFGFYLISAASGMAKGSSLSFRLFYPRIPILAGVIEYAAQGMVPGGAYCNQEFFIREISISPKVPEAERIILFDPQTSGGLLMALPSSAGEEFLRRLKEKGIAEASLIGEVIPKGKYLINVE